MGYAIIVKVLGTLLLNYSMPKEQDKTDKKGKNVLNRTWDDNDEKNNEYGKSKEDDN